MDQGEICSLPPQDQEERVAMFRREILPHALGAKRLARGRAWRFPSEPALKTRLEALVAFERGCCGGLSWNLDEAARELELRIEGLDPDSDFFTTLDADPRGKATRRFGAGGILAGAAGFAACETPLVLAALGAGAARLLDVLSLAAVLGGLALLAFAWLRRRKRIET